MIDKMGDRLKAIEMMEAGRKFLPLLPICARIDGRSFSKFTKGLARPYDKRMSDLMIETTKYLVDAACAKVGYTQSDEISLLWYENDVKQTSFFDGRIQKMVSILGSMATGYFNRHVEGVLGKLYWDRFPMFDARVWTVPTLEEAANVLLWREWDATKNSIGMAASHYYSHNQLMGKNSSEKQELLFQKGINWNDYPTFFKRGTYVTKRKMMTPFSAFELDKLPPKHAARTNPALLVERTIIETPELQLGKVVNKIDVLFRGAIPILTTDKK